MININADHIGVPIAATLYVTDHCQLSCGHCFLTDQNVLCSHHLPLEMIDNVISDLSENGVLMLGISGGDPFLHPQFAKIVERTIEARMTPLIGITGLVYDKNNLKELKTLGINHLQVSVDYDQNVIAAEPVRCSDGPIGIGISSLIREGFRITVAVCVHADNVTHTSRIVRRWIRNGCERIKIVFWEPTPLGLTRGYRPIDADQRKLVIRDILRIADDPSRLVFPGYKLSQDGNPDTVLDVNERLVVRANGDISFDEFSKPISNLMSDTASGAYIGALRKVKLSKITEITENWKKSFNLKFVWREDRAKLRCSGIAVKNKGERLVMVASDLSEGEYLLVLAHEIGHLELDILSKNGAQNSVDEERSVNIWAMRLLKEHIAMRTYKSMMKAATEHDEEKLFAIARQKMLGSIIT